MNAVSPSDAAASRAWNMAPVVALRQAGFPFDTVDVLAAPEVTADIAEQLDIERTAIAVAAELKAAIRRSGAGRGGDLGSAVGMLRPLTPEVVMRLEAALDADGRATLDAYTAVVTDAEQRWRQLSEALDDHLARARAALVESFRTDPLLREVLLLSNDKQYPIYAEWLDDPAVDRAGARARKMADLLTMYLQRVATKNETHSHFGPVSGGRLGDRNGVTWREGPLARVTFCAYWAAEKIATRISAHPDLRPLVRPRRRPWAFVRDGRVYLYEFTTETGYISDWSFQRVGDAPIAPAAAWLLAACDGDTTVGQLCERYATAVAEGRIPGGEDFDAVLAGLVAAGWAVNRFEVPIGTPYPLAAIREQLPESGAGAEWAHDILDRFERLLADMATAHHDDRPGLIAAMKSEFEQVTGEPANRGGGRHYADRGVFFEESHGALHDLEVGPDVAAFVADDLAAVYDLVLAGPRLLMARETTILSDWVTKRFGAGVQVPLDRFYEGYFADRARLADECKVVQGELDALDTELTGLLLDGADPAASEIEVSRERIAAFVARYPTDPPALCNPDVMIAASPEGLARGDFSAVIGDCHAVREVLSHTSFTPLVAQRVPELTEVIAAQYAGLLADDELLCDMARSHPNKTGSQVVFPGPDIEIFGRSPKPRRETIQPSQMYVVVDSGRLELRVHGRPERLRMQAPPAGGPSIMQDPLSPFAFPRHFGGIGLRAGDLPHLPRIRFGRVVVSRQAWRLPSGALRGRRPGGNGASGELAEFFAAQVLRADLGLPRYVFAKVQGEPKPLFVDFEAPLLVRQLVRMARAANGRIELSEMLPSPDELWLQIGGRRYTSELRCAVFNRGPR